MDLRGADPMDPPSVIKARQIEAKFIKKWIDQARKNPNEQFGPGPESIVVG